MFWTILQGADRATTYDDTLGKYDMMWGRSEVLYHRDNTI